MQKQRCTLIYPILPSVNFLNELFSCYFDCKSREQESTYFISKMPKELQNLLMGLNITWEGHGGQS